MQNMSLVDEVVGIVAAYYVKELGMSLNVAMKPICFCVHNPKCSVVGCIPMTVPDAHNNHLQIHISSIISPGWYPNQLLYQYSHELWHAYEFSQYGLSYPWQVFEDRIEPYAYAASLCALSQGMIPERILPRTSQDAYFKAIVASDSKRDMYAPGASIAKEVGYDLKKLYEQYQQIIAPQILG